MNTHKQQVARLLRSARRQGWRVVSKQGHHYVWAPNGRKYTVPGSPLNEGAVWMSRKKLAKAGLEVEK